MYTLVALFFYLSTWSFTNIQTSTSSNHYQSTTHSIATSQTTTQIYTKQPTSYYLLMNNTQSTTQGAMTKYRQSIPCMGNLESRVCLLWRLSAAVSLCSPKRKKTLSLLSDPTDAFFPPPVIKHNGRPS